MRKLQPERVREFRRKILSWYKKNKRDLPWRHPSLKLRNGKGRDPYAILVSEVMLQQTQVSRVIEKYNEWIKAFPTIRKLAKASFRDILSRWSGLGYNRRALYLQQLAQDIVKNHHGKFPQNEKELQKLPGIGEYTARAILCFAFNEQVAVVDTNIRKVILTNFFSERARRVEEPSTGSGKKGSGQARMTDKEIQEIANQLLPKGKAYEWNQALMDYASSELKQEKIPIPKQSKFKDSDRYYRGEILRMLLTNPAYSFEEVQKHFVEIKKEISSQRLERIVQTLYKDRFIEYTKSVIVLRKN